MKKDKLLHQFKKFEEKKINELKEINGGKGNVTWEIKAVNIIIQTGTVGSDSCGTDSTMECVDMLVTDDGRRAIVSSTYNDF